MTLPELSIKRHVLAYMMSAVLVLLGVISYQRIGIDRMPYIEFPMMQVITSLRGANPDIVDSSITNILESKLNTIPGIEHIQSQSSPGVSAISIAFTLDKDIGVAFNEVQAKVSQVLRQLPRDADPPVVSKVETNTQPILWLSLQGDRTQQQLNLFASNVIKKRLETIDGVGEVRLGGRRDRVIRVYLQPERMAALGVTTQDLTDAFQNEHLQSPGGFIVGAKTEYLLKLDLEFHSLQALREMIVARRDGALIKLQDVATVEDGLEEYRQLARYNGRPSVGLGIVKIANTNTVAIIEKVKERLEREILPQLPPGMTLQVSSDDSTFIKEMVATLKEHLVLATLLASLVVLLFLKSLRSTLIIALAIPVSLMGAVAAMYFAGFTFNAMTLLAMLLLIGVVVDDAIVVLENIYRQREAGETDPARAALIGSRQVVFAVLASSLTLISIFAPVIFMQGIIGRFFEAFAVVVTVGVLVSLFVSLTLTPMLCARHLRLANTRHWAYRAFDEPFRRLDRVYRVALDWTLRWRWTVVVITLLIVASSGWFISNVGKTFAPEEDESRFMVFFKAPLGASLQYTDDRLREIERVLGSRKEVLSYFTAIGLGQAGQVNQGIAFVRMVPRHQRALSQNDFVNTMRKELGVIPGVRAFPASAPLLPGMRSEALQFVVTGENLQELARHAQALVKKLSETPGMGRLDLDLNMELPQIDFALDRHAIAQAGLHAKDVAQAINILSGGSNVARYSDIPGDGQRYDIRLKAREGDISRVEDLKRIYLRTQQGKMVRLDSLATAQRVLGPAIIPRYDLRYGAMAYSNPTLPLGEAVIALQNAAAEILPSGYAVHLVGEAEQFAKTQEYTQFLFLLAMILVYMVLASQFNSFTQPLIIMLAQPLAIVGGVAALWLMDHTLNVYSMIGLVLLIGLVAKNSILLVDMTNQLRAEGQDIRSALLEACPIRMRPVLMTSLTIILALLPAAWGLGAGADTNGPLSVAVIGGMLSSTLLTLVVVPAVYSLAEEGMQRWRTRRLRAASP